MLDRDPIVRVAAGRQHDGAPRVDGGGARGGADQEEARLRARPVPPVSVRCGKKKVAVAVGHIILRSAHYLRVQETTYHEQGLAHFDERRRARTQQRALDQLKALGYDVALTRRPRRHDARDVFQENTRFALRMFARTRA